MNSLGPLAFIGAGNMAEAIFAGLLESERVAPDAITASDPNPNRLADLHNRYGIVVTADNQAAVKGRQVVVLAVKPQMMNSVLPPLSPCLEESCLVVSVAAGVTTGMIQRHIGTDRRVVRVMPNTPALVGKGASAIAAGPNATPDDLARVEALFGAVGATAVVKEDELAAVTAVSGSGPAYVFLLAEALAEAGVAAGFVNGAGKHPGQADLGRRRHDVGERRGGRPGIAKTGHKPGGTTAAGLAVLDQRDETGGLRALLAATVAAAKHRAEELAKDPD